MDAEKTKKVNGKKIEQFYWNGSTVVYIDNKLTSLTFNQAVAKCRDDYVSN